MMQRDIIQPIIERIRDLPVSRVVVFGSTIDGSADAESDLDLAVVVPDPKRTEEFDRIALGVEIRRRIRDINRAVALDVLVYTESEFRNLASEPGFVKSEVLERGEVVYERAG